MCKTDPPELVRRSVCDCDVAHLHAAKPDAGRTRGQRSRRLHPFPTVATFSDGFDAVLVIATFPVTAPAAVGIEGRSERRT